MIAKFVIAQVSIVDSRLEVITGEAAPVCTCAPEPAVGFRCRPELADIQKLLEVTEFSDCILHRSVDNHSKLVTSLTQYETRRPGLPTLQHLQWFCNMEMELMKEQ